MNIYDKLGVKRLINAMATATAIGGSIMPEEVLDAMREASRNYVRIGELMEKACEHIAKITNNEAALICNSAASGVFLTVTACMTDGDANRAWTMPDLSGLKTEIVVNHHNPNGFEAQISNTGAKIVTYGDKDGCTAEQLEAAITENTAAIFSFHYGLHDEPRGQLPLEEQIRIAKKHKIPCIIDAAAQIPKRENLWRYTRDLGADLAIFSGGKGMRGPQASGLIVGSKEMVGKVAAVSFPGGGVGRTMKVGKEEIAGLMKAVEIVMEQDEDALLAGYEKQIQELIGAFEGDAAVAVTRGFPSEAGQPMPRGKISVVNGKLKITAAELNEKLKEGDPIVWAGFDGESIVINPQTLMDGEMKIVISRIKEIINANRV